MKAFYKKLNKYYKVALWTMVATLFLFCCFIPLFFNGWMEIPLGLLLGGGLGALIYLIQGIGEKKEVENQTHTFSMVMIGVRYILFVGVIVALAFVYYYFKFHLFNVFSFVGGYTISLLSLVFVMIRNKD